MKTPLMNQKNLLVQIIILMLVFPIHLNAQQTDGAKKEDSAKTADVKTEDTKSADAIQDTAQENKFIFDKTGGDIWLNKRLSMSPMFGMVLNDAYTNIMEFGAAFNYSLTPRSGIEMTFLVMSPSDTDVLNYYTARSNYNADHNNPNMFIGFDYTYVLFTSTMNFRDTKKMPYFLKVAPGIGMTMLKSASYSPPPAYPPVSQSQMAITASLDVIQEFFLSDRLSVRFDIRNHIYPETIYGSNSGASLRSRLNIDTGLMLGASWYCMPSSSKFKFSECF